MASVAAPMLAAASASPLPSAVRKEPPVPWAAIRSGQPSAGMVAPAGRVSAKQTSSVRTTLGPARSTRPPCSGVS